MMIMMVVGGVVLSPVQQGGSRLRAVFAPARAAYRPLAYDADD